MNSWIANPNELAGMASKQCQVEDPCSTGASLSCFERQFLEMVQYLDTALTWGAVGLLAEWLENKTSPSIQIRPSLSVVL